MTRILISLICCIFLFTSCPEPTDNELECGAHQIIINGTCECEEGYHLDGPDSTECILDSTSHAFFWQIDTLGEFGSYLNDVTIVDENNVWVVGEIVLPDPDSSWNGTGREHFGAAIWNGSNWTFKHLQYQPRSEVKPRGIWAFSEENIWFASGSIYHWDGNETTLEWLRNIGTSETVEKIWASSQSNIFFVGNEGTIIHYNGESFERMESGTDSPLRDIWGLDEDNVWCVGYTNTIDDDHPDGYENVLLFFNGQEWTKQYVSAGYFPVLSDTLSSRVHAVWSYDDSLYVTSVGGLWKESVMDGGGYLTQQQDLGAYDWFLSRIRGNGYNDVFIMSAFGQVTHFNGGSWQVIYDLTEQFYDPPALSWSLAVKGDVLVFVGLENQSGKALVVRGYR